MWAKITHELGATDERAMQLRFHTQTGGSTLTAQQPLNNIVRVGTQALAAVLGGTQSLHTNGYDEALSLPTEEAAKIALRTQQLIAFESGVTETVDPLAGSYFVEELTNTIEEEAWKYIHKIDAMGGSVNAIEQGFIQDEIANASYQYQKDIESGARIIVGVNKFSEKEKPLDNVFRVDDSIRTVQTEKLQKLKAERNATEVNDALETLKIHAQGTENLMPDIIRAVEAYATLGEIADTLREVFGEY
jgi:methylmalonyl-CoA mutase N-terminal domain/subunit